MKSNYLCMKSNNFILRKYQKCFPEYQSLINPEKEIKNATPFVEQLSLNVKTELLFSKEYNKLKARVKNILSSINANPKEILSKYL